jgi:hypothetical protein
MSDTKAAALAEQEATCRALVEAQQRADAAESKCTKFAAALEAAQIELAELRQEINAAREETEQTAAQLDAQAAEHSAALGGVSRALQESQSARDDLAAQLDAAREEIATYAAWWPFEVIGQPVFVTVGDGEGELPWSGVFQTEQDAWRWAEDMRQREDDGRDHNVMTGELQGLRFWNSIDPAPSAKK